MNYKYSLIAAAIFAASCGNSNDKKNEQVPVGNTLSAKDEHTQSNADSVTMKHLDLDIAVDLTAKRISGSATWQIENKTTAGMLRLDTYDLSIDSVTVDGTKADFKLDGFVQHLGSRLNIPVTKNSKSVTIYYKTGEKATALQWLAPQQTLGKKQPFLYTQSESIYARSWIPCADGPGIRYTYNARVTVPKGLMALMSAENPQQVSDSGIYQSN